VTLVVGVQTVDTQEPRQGLSRTTQQAVPVVVEQVRRLLAEHA
jgi:hydrogenase maturation protease